ncbi:hypothetical protein [Amycolatopsis sp. FDAARGOS 1241]|uniref:hypothetical protein n=1 Tax=Amycolatopsis sp. FDAARGOS 1241 TaxID=2778070 RepID=UPI0019520BF9|nr:hypothetical protein [Amycolatopsis sp. FDAARGOS 1241]QRP49378.1 hypothetical protein I6J71_17415 [Amycolatopsis sp. FDAARGOS 1241]
MSEITGHEELIDRAFATAGTTGIVLPPVDVNGVLHERYEVTPPASFTATSLWDMEVRKAKAPDKYLPALVKPGSLEVFPGERHGRFEDFTRVSEQGLWLKQDTFGVVVEHVRLDHHDKRAYFVGAERYRAPDGRAFEAGTGQPIFHVEHSVAGSEEAPLNLWRIVHLTDRPDPALVAYFDGMGRDPYLRVFNEVYLREDLNRTLMRR